MHLSAQRGYAWLSTIDAAWPRFQNAALPGLGGSAAGLLQREQVDRLPAFGGAALE
jgi:hypothetical protein